MHRSVGGDRRHLQGQAHYYLRSEYRLERRPLRVRVSSATVIPSRAAVTADADTTATFSAAPLTIALNTLQSPSPANATLATGSAAHALVATLSTHHIPSWRSDADQCGWAAALQGAKLQAAREDGSSGKSYMTWDKIEMQLLVKTVALVVRV